jgi:hypothetical protein
MKKLTIELQMNIPQKMLARIRKGVAKLTALGTERLRTGHANFELGMT